MVSGSTHADNMNFLSADSCGKGHACVATEYIHFLNFWPGAHSTGVTYFFNWYLRLGKETNGHFIGCIYILMAYIFTRKSYSCLCQSLP